MYAFIAAHESAFSVKAMCHVLGVQHSGYYAWKGRAVSARELASVELMVKIREAFEISRNTCGSLRIQHYWLHKGCGFSRHRIGRLMKKASLVPLKAAKWHPQTTRQRLGARIAPNLTRISPLYIPTRNGQAILPTLRPPKAGYIWLYLAVILDLYSRRVVGWPCGTGWIPGWWRAPGAWR